VLLAGNRRMPLIPAASAILRLVTVRYGRYKIPPPALASAPRAKTVSLSRRERLENASPTPHWRRLAEGCSEGSDKLGLLFREDGAEVEDQAVVFDAGDYADARGGVAEALFELSGGVAGAGDADDFCGEGLRRGGAASG
jgi:hypothetical protein